MANLKILTDEIFNALVKAGVDIEPIRGYGMKSASSYFMSLVYQALKKSAGSRRKIICLSIWPCC
jgi:hypothetical protein